MQNFLIFTNLIDYIKAGNFLLVDSSFNKHWNGPDNRESYIENLKRQPADWYYRNNSVNYTFNRHGYRTYDFKKINWRESIVIFGCSNVLGTGLTDSDTLSAQLEKIINRPVINMGINGSSIEFSLYNSIILNQSYPTPKAVVQLWTGANRTIYFNKRSVETYGPWNMVRKNYVDHWNKDSTHGRVHALFANMISKQIWSNKTRYYEATFFFDTMKLLNCDYFSPKDLARDLTHPGRETIKEVANKIALELKL